MARFLWSDRGVTGTALVILSLGVGTATATFVVFQAVVVRDLPVRESDRLVVLWSFRDPTVELPLGATQVEYLGVESRTMSGVAGFNHYGTFNPPMTESDRPIVLRGAGVTANFFDVLGADPVLGRLLQPEDRDAASRVAVISFRAWQRLFGSDPQVLGRQLRWTHDQQVYTIVGVAPPGLDFPAGVEYWIPVGPPPLPGVGFDVVARLAPRATPEMARSEFLSIVQRVDLQRAVPLRPAGAAVQPLRQAVLGDSMAILVAAATSVALLLLIACLNVGNLLVLRGTRRARDVAIHRALGASYGRLARRLLAENAALGVLGGVLGLGLAQAILFLMPLLAPSQIPRAEMIRMAGVPFGIAAGVTMVAILLFGTLPALAGARGHAASGLRLDSRSVTHGSHRTRLRSVLVAAQVGMSLIMLTGAGLLIRTVQQLGQLSLGYETTRLSIGQLSFPFTDYDTQAEVDAALGELFERLRALPGVTALTPVILPPFLGANVWQASPILEGQSQTTDEALTPVPVEAGGPDYFRTFQIPILRGRAFTEGDRAEAPLVVVVSQAVAARLWPNQDPLGKRLRFGVDTTQWRTVVGVAGDIRFRRLREPTPTLYLPWRQFTTQGFFALRTQDDLATVLPAMRRTVQDFSPRMNVWDVQTMVAYLQGPLSQPRLGALLLLALGGAAILIAAIGLYGLMASAVRERSRDLSVRIALGATPGRLRREVVGKALGVTTLGVAGGLAGVGFCGRFISGLLFEVGPGDPTTLVGVSLVFWGVAVIAAYLPARRATMVEPMMALRAD
jgi:predicted permease